MPDSVSTGVEVRLAGSHLHVDARPARLVSMLRGVDAEALISAHPVKGASHVDAFPAAARQATFRLRDDLAVEATPAASFVAIAEETGRCLVIAYEGEVTVVPGGSDRFALTGNEALLVTTAGDPRLIPASELTADNHPDLASLLDEVAAIVLGAGAAGAPSAAPAEAPAQVTVPSAPPKIAPSAAAGVATAGGAAAAAATGQAAAASGQRRKKGKKGRPQPARGAPSKASPSKSAPAKSAPGKSGPAKKAAAGTGAAAGATAAGASKTTSKAAATKAGGGGKPPSKVPPKKTGGGGGGDSHDESYEDTPRDKRFLIGSIIVALVLAVGAVLLLSNTDDDSTEVATDTTTTEAETTDPTQPPTTEAPVTTVAPAATAAPTTTVAPATTARPTTTVAAPVADYSIEPRSCVQNGNSVTYTASVKNNAAGPFDFAVDVSFRTTDGNEVAKTTANVTRLASGRTAEFSATGTSSRSLAGSGATCDVVRVDAKPSA